MPQPNASAARAWQDEWELHRRELSRLFIAERLPVADIARYMKNEYGFDKKPKDYEYRLKKWNLRRNLHAAELRFIQGELSRREQAGRTSEIVVSGSRWPLSVFRGRLERHKFSRISDEQFDVDVLPDFLARVQTPSPLMQGLSEWPKELPWLQFNQFIHRALANLTTSTTIAQTFRPQGQEALLIRMMRPYISKRVLERTEPLEVDSIHPRRRMRAMLEILAPQAYACDHETIAEVLHTGSHESLAVELVRLLIYCESNNMGGRFEQILGCKVKFSTPANIMDFLRGLGFLTKANIKWLAGRADPTSQTFLNRLLAFSTIEGNSVDVLGWLIPDHFDVNLPLQIPLDDRTMVYTYQHARYRYADNNSELHVFNPTLLQTACLAGNISAISLLLDLRTDPYGISAPLDRTPLECAASLACHERASTITSLLLSKSSIISSEARKKALENALRRAIFCSHTKIITRLLWERERLGDGTICSQHITIAAKYADYATLRLLVELAARHGDGSIRLTEDIFQFSAIFGSLRGYLDHDDLDQMFEKLNYLLSVGANPAVPKCSYRCMGSLILDLLIQDPDQIVEKFNSLVNVEAHSAADFRRCFFGCIGELVLDFSMQPNGNMSRNPRAYKCVLETIKALRKPGYPQERSKSTLSALQLAVKSGCPQLVEFLLDWGADIDFVTCEPESDRSASENCDLHKQEFPGTEGRSPLLTALLTRSKKIAKMLLRRKPTLKLRGGEEHLAMKIGDDPELVAMLLRAGSAEIDGWKTFFEQAVLKRYPESIKFLLSMETNGPAALEPITIMRAALITGDYNRASQQVTVCGYDSRTLFDALLQSNLNEEFHTIVQRLLQMRINTSNDDFEICAVAYAAIHHDTHLLGCLMKSFGQGPWIGALPYDGSSLDSWLPNASMPTFPVHILSYAAKFCCDKPWLDELPLKLLLGANVPATGMSLEELGDLSAETLTQLIAAGLDPEPGLLWHALNQNKLSHVQALCEAKVNVNAMHKKLDFSRTAMQLAIQSGRPEMLQLLLRYGAGLDSPCGYLRGATCLQIAAGGGNIGLVRFLLDKGANVNAKRSLLYGRTAIEIAAENGRLDVSKLLLLQHKNVCQSTAERYQIIRAAKLAEQNGHGVLAKMLKHHIKWDSDDQRHFDEIPDCRNPIFQLDDMTQKVSDSEKREDSFWSSLDDIRKEAGVDDIYDIDGIEQWIGEDDRYPISESDFSSEEEANIHMRGSDSPATAGQRVAECEEPASDCNQPPELKPMHVHIDDAMTCAESLCFESISEQPGTHFQTLPMHAAPAQGETALAPRATRYDSQVPAWLNLEDNMYDLGDDVAFEEVADHRSATENLHRISGMVIGEVQELHDEELCGQVGFPFNAEEGHSGEHFDWGFWDEDGVGRELPGLDLGFDSMQQD